MGLLIILAPFIANNLLNNSRSPYISLTKCINVALEYAVAYAYMGNFDKGIQILKDSIGTSTKPQLLYNELGGIYWAKGDTASAIIAYKQAIECNPNYARPYINLAELYKCKNEKELAINHYFEAIKLFAQYEYYEEMGNFAAEVLNIDSTNIEANKFLQYYTSNAVLKLCIMHCALCIFINLCVP